MNFAAAIFPARSSSAQVFSLSPPARTGGDPKDPGPRGADDPRGLYPHPGRCTCGTELREVEGELWCPTCGCFQPAPTNKVSHRENGRQNRARGATHPDREVGAPAAGLMT